MIIRVLIINRQLVFAVTIKQALEQTGAFEVHPFTDPNAAMEYLRTHPHDVALIDFDIRILPGAEIVRQLREIQPEIAIIASPMQPDSSRMIRDLELQGMIDAPFSARGIIPLIEHAVEQMAQPGRAITRSFVEPDQPGTDTEILGRPDPSEPRPRPPIQRTEPAHTRILSDEDNPPPARIPPEADDEPENLPNTRMLPGDEPAQTRILQEDSSPDDLPQTRILPGVEEDDLPPVPPSTRILPGHTDRPAAPPRLPEFSSLDDILADEAPSSLFEPPVRDGDTPAVPSVDSDAVRQFLATSSDQGDRTFDSMLSEISPDESADGPPQLPGGDFQDLVNSMRAEQAHTPLPDRHQQFVEFILTGGMDNLLSEIEKAKTGPLEDEEGEIPEPPPAPKLRKLSPPPKSQPPATTFEKLAADEPPMPALEEGGTVSDLMVGVSDTSFRNVLAMMRGEEAGDEGTSAQPPASVSRAEIEAAYAAFFDQTTEQEAELEPEDTPPSLPEPEPDESSITAQLILETALDES
ncbi:MAG: response regulator, partial [Anaerolineae bacterium]|nr:response regulator [Anaerolineae bacterium]